MQLTQKHIISLATVSIFAMIGYGIFQNSTPSQSDGVNISTGTSDSISQSDTGVETDTGKRLETVANSGTQWGMSPFGSGKPLEEAEKKPVFQKPNTEWKTRTLSGITYVFGEGNPSGVDLTVDELKKDAKETCPENLDVTRNFCTEESGYVSQEVEKYLLAALSDPKWASLMNRCEDNLRRSDPAVLENHYQASYDRILNKDYLDINSWLTINSTTGRKVLNMGKVIDLQNWLKQSTAAAWEEYNSPVPNTYKDPTCVDLYGTEIIRNLILTRVYYVNPPEVF